MNKLLLPALIVVASLGSALAADYKAVPDWYKLAPGRPMMGNMHGDVAVASNGEVYVSVMDPKARCKSMRRMAPSSASSRTRRRTFMAS
ncbi:MAG: hypothetical protein WDN28_33935 [Chthoniobacter sp.]